MKFMGLNPQAAGICLPCTWVQSSGLGGSTGRTVSGGAQAPLLPAGG